MISGFNQKGFTIIELSLAMTFVSLLLIAVAMLSIQLTNQYSRGLTLKEVSQAGTEMANDVKRTMAQVQVQGAGVRAKSIAGGGRVLCTGTYSYVASSPESLEANNGNGDSNAIRIGPDSSTTMARFAKVRDIGGTLCSDNKIDTEKRVVTNDVSELLAGGSRLLAVRELTVTPNGIPAPSHPFYSEFTQGKGLYIVSFTISAGLSAELDSSTGSCRAPSDNQSNLDYCAINRFEFMSRVGNSNR